jgi:co-chaperonin GroES (HSP10)
MKTDRMQKYLIGDRILTRPTDVAERNRDGTVVRQNQHQNMIYAEVIQTGPGYLSSQAAPDGAEGGWKSKEDLLKERFISLTVEAGDYVFFLPDHAIPIELDNEQHYLVREGEIMLGLRE